MDAAKVGDRKKTENRPLTRLEYQARTTLFESGYELKDHWMFGLKSDFYTLDGEYELDPTHTLHRWVLDESQRSKLTNADSAPHEYHIIIDSETPPGKFVAGSYVFETKKRK